MYPNNDMCPRNKSGNIENQIHFGYKRDENTKKNS